MFPIQRTFTELYVLNLKTIKSDLKLFLYIPITNLRNTSYLSET